MKALVAPTLLALLLTACAQAPQAPETPVAQAADDGKCVASEAPLGSSIRKRVPCDPPTDKQREASQEKLRRMQDAAEATSKTY